MGILPTKILAATDGSGVATFAVDAAAELAHKTGSELHLAYVLPMTVVYSTADVVLAGGVPLYDKVRREGEELLAGHARRAEEAGAAVAETHFLEGEPDAEIVGLGERLGAGLIVVGNRGLGPLARTLLGSVSDSVVRHAHCPVLVVRREDG